MCHDPSLQPFERREVLVGALSDASSLGLFLFLLRSFVDEWVLAWLCASAALLMIWPILLHGPFMGTKLRHMFVLVFMTIITVYLPALTRAPPPSVETLIFTDPGWSDVSCAAAAQARRFSTGGVGAVTVLMFEHDAHFCERKRVEMAPSGADFRCIGSLLVSASPGGDGWCMPTYYDELLYRRLRATIAQLAATRADGLLLLDSDTALFRNIGVRMARAGTDFVFQRELPCHTERRRRCINAGVWWVRARSDAVEAVLRHALHLMAHLHISDQDALQHALAVSNCTVTYLDPALYPNGFLYNFDARLRAARVHMVHVNWSPPGFVEKRQRLYDLGVVERYPQCFGRALRYRDARANATRLPSGFLLPRAMPRGVSWRDLGNALGCADVDDRRCIAARAEPRALPHYLPQ